jgi:hypothetical protein
MPSDIVTLSVADTKALKQWLDTLVIAIDAVE